MATLASATMARDNLAFIGRSYQPLSDHLGAHARSSFAALVTSWKHENRPDSWVGRLHYSLRPTLSAHFR